MPLKKQESQNDLLESWRRCLADDKRKAKDDAILPEEEEEEEEDDLQLGSAFSSVGIRGLNSDNVDDDFWSKVVEHDENLDEAFWAEAEEELMNFNELRREDVAGAAWIDVNTNLNTGLSSQQADGLVKPVLERDKRKCRSSPELWRPVEKRRDFLGEIRRSLSHQDLPWGSRSLKADGRKSLRVGVEEDNDTVPSLLWDEEAYRHYKLLTMIEQKMKLRQIQRAKTTIIKKYMWKQRILQVIVDHATAYYSNPSKENRKRWKQLRTEIGQSEDHSFTDLMHGLAQVPYHRPFFTTFLTVAHLLSLVIMCAVGGVAPAGVLSQKEVKRGVQTFLGAETVHRYVIPNPWIGPPAHTLLSSGASFGLCMRFERRLGHEGQLMYRVLDDTFGCCEMRGAINAAGTTTRKECSNYTNNAGVWSPPWCSQRSSPGSSGAAHVMRPCCLDHRGTCRTMSQQHCTFLGGDFHPFSEHCAQVLCVRDVCTTGKNLSQIRSNSHYPWLPAQGVVWQWWRPFVSLIYTYGLVHCLALLTLEWLLLRPLETSNGWLQALLIYALCGVAGQIVACTVQPHIPHVGSTSGVAGMIGEASVELSQAWALLERPQREALKLASFLAGLLVLGLLPYVSLLGTVTGCGCGALSALVFMPYITVDKVGRRRQLVMMGSGVVGLLVFYTLILYTFVSLQPPPCQSCRRLECLSFAPNMCNQWDLLG